MMKASPTFEFYEGACVALYPFDQQYVVEQLRRGNAVSVLREGQLYTLCLPCYTDVVQAVSQDKTDYETWQYFAGSQIWVGLPPLPAVPTCANQDIYALYKGFGLTAVLRYACNSPLEYAPRYKEALFGDAEWNDVVNESTGFKEEYGYTGLDIVTHLIDANGGRHVMPWVAKVDDNPIVTD